jgi:phosphoglycolate phosphatase
MPAPRFATVLLDCDGTLLNTIDDLAAAGNHVCAAHGWPTHATDAYKRMVGDGQRVLVSRFVPATVAADEAALEAAYQEFEAYYSAHKEDATAPYPGVVEALRELAAAGVRMGVLTNKNQDSADVLVAKYFGGLVDAVQGRVDGVPAKPDPAMTNALMARLGADPATTLMVGDTRVDVACGTNAGVVACGVLWGFRDRAELEDAGARWVVSTPEELVGVVLG